MKRKYGVDEYTDGQDGEVYEEHIVYLYSCERGLDYTWYAVQACCLRKYTSIFSRLV